MTNTRYYFQSISMMWKSQMQYLSSLWMQICGSLLMTGGELCGVLILFDRFPQLGQWTRGEVLLFYGIMQLSFALVEMLGRGFTAFRVIDGSFDRVLLRPRSVILQIIASQLDLRRIGGVLVSIVALGYGISQVSVEWSIEKCICLGLAVTGGVALILGLFVLEAALMFKLLQNVEATNIFTYGGRMAAQYPIDIYKVPFRWLFLYLFPYGLTMHIPAAYILGKPLFGWENWAAFVSPASGVIFLLGMLWLFISWAKGYQSTGS